MEESGQNRIILTILGIIAVLVLAACAILALVKKEETGEQSLKMNDEELAELHVFPPIPFADSLCVAKTISKYDDDTPRDVYYYALDSDGQPTDSVVHESSFYPDQSKYIDGNIANDARDGLWYAYHKNGHVQTMAHYEKGKEQGQYTVYYEDGSVMYTGVYDKGKREGVWRFYAPDGTLTRTEDCDVHPHKVTIIK